MTDPKWNFVQTAFEADAIECDGCGHRSRGICPDTGPYAECTLGSHGPDQPEECPAFDRLAAEASAEAAE